MKRLLILLCFVPMTALAVPSVRTLGGKNVSGTVVNSNLSKVEKVKTNIGTNSGTSASTTSGARIGTLRAKSSKTDAASGAMTSSLSRLPVIVPVKNYDSTNTGYAGYASGGECCNVDTNAIIAAVMEKVDENYYNKSDVYNNNNFVQAVKDIIDEDDPRIDAIKIGSKPVHSNPLPSDYVYMWIER